MDSAEEKFRSGMKVSRDYFLLLGSQFLSAFGDNIVLAVILGQLTIQYKAGLLTNPQLGMANVVYTCLFFIPYVLGASVSGYLNDRFPKTRWLLGGNLLKLTGALFCALSVWHGEIWQKIGYFVVGLGACVYGPAKYGILPEILPRERLVKANGSVELLTILAILAGPLTGARMVDHWTKTIAEPGRAILLCYAVVASIFVVSLVMNLFMSTTPFNRSVRLAPSTAEFLHHFGDLLRSPRLSRVLLGTGIFWVCGAVLKMNFQPWGLHILKMENNEQIARLGLWLGLGIIGGSLLAGQLHRVGDLRWTQRYGWFLAGAILLLSVVTQSILIMIILGLIGLLAGLFLIPLNASLQAESDPAKLGKTVAAQNLVDNIAMVAGGGYVYAANAVKMDAQWIFSGLGLLIAIAICCLRIPVRAIEITEKPAGKSVPT
jgi:MFS transporter, LPLT family, lysophospholipid transporter